MAWLPYQLVGYLAIGSAPGRNGSGIGILAPYAAFPTLDGWLMIAAGNDRLFAALCRVLDLDQLVDDERFRTNSERVAHRDALTELVSHRTSTSTAAEWEAVSAPRAFPLPVSAT